MTTSRGKNHRGSSTICLPIRKEVYDSIVEDPEKFRAAVDQAFSDMPELFPKAFAQGYILKDSRLSRKLGMLLRRVECKVTQEAFTVRPSFVMPYMTALTDEVGLEEAYRVFAREAENVEAGYKPQTVNADGWAATHAAWRAMFPLVVV